MKRTRDDELTKVWKGVVGSLLASSHQDTVRQWSPNAFAHLSFSLPEVLPVQSEVLMKLGPEITQQALPSVPGG